MIVPPTLFANSAISVCLSFQPVVPTTSGSPNGKSALIFSITEDGCVNSIMPSAPLDFTARHNA